MDTQHSLSATCTPSIMQHEYKLSLHCLICHWQYTIKHNIRHIPFAAHLYGKSRTVHGRLSLWPVYQNFKISRLIPSMLMSIFFSASVSDFMSVSYGELPLFVHTRWTLSVAFIHLLNHDLQTKNLLSRAHRFVEQQQRSVRHLRCGIQSASLQK